MSDSAAEDLKINPTAKHDPAPRVITSPIRSNKPQTNDNMYVKGLDCHEQLLLVNILRYIHCYYSLSFSFSLSFSLIITASV